MKKKLLSGFLAFIFIIQIFVFGLAFAKESNSSSGNFVTIGKLSKEDYPQIDPATLLRVAKEERAKANGMRGREGATLFSSDSQYIKDKPNDKDKPKYWAEIKGEVITNGIDGGTFDWDKVIGKGQKIRLRFFQSKKGLTTGIEYNLDIDSAGEYFWTDGAGNPTYLPLFDGNGDAYEYNITIINESISEKAQLIVSTSNGTPRAKFRTDGDKEVATISFLNIKIQQLASTKFVSEWHTSLAENDRPQIEGEMAFNAVDSDGSQYVAENTFNFPKNDTEWTILRESFEHNFEEDEDNDVYPFLPSEIKTSPTKVGVNTNIQGLTFDTANKTVKSGDHKFKYDLTYDVINGGKLTMTEILPITFDANGGEFENFTSPDTDEKIVKEVDYDGNLREEDIEKPKKSLETFKGWAKDKDGPVLNEEEFKAEITNITKAKTFYAIWDNNDLIAKELVVYESYKDGSEYKNGPIPKYGQLKDQVKIKDENGKPEALVAGKDDFYILNDKGMNITNGDDLNSYLYEKLKEEDNPGGKPTRTVHVEAKVIRNGKEQTVDIPIKVIKNIYEAKTSTKKPYYVPDEYVKVTLDPTTTAKDPQKTYYYVNPKAKVVIPGNNPEGVGDNLFVRWKMKADDARGEGETYELEKQPRTQFEKDSTIWAEYTKDVIPQIGTETPKDLPDNFVKVTFNPTDKGTMEGAKIFWVKKDRDVIIPVKDPVGKQYQTFDKWKMGKKADGDEFKPTEAHRFSEDTTITATYKEAENIIPYDPKEPITRPNGYVRVTFEAEKGLKLKESKAYYVKKNAKDTEGNPLTLKTIKDDNTKGYPKYKEETGYKFEKWDPADTTQIEKTDIVVKAKATKLDKVYPAKDDQGNDNKKPEGYKEVNFVVKTEDKEKGRLEGVTKFYVNPKEYVTINPPNTIANTGYEFGSWDKDTTRPTLYTQDTTTITASFNGKDDVIPKTTEDDSEKPDGYVTVTFEIEGEGGSIVDQEITTYYVNPKKPVTINPPKILADTGYKFNEWDHDTKEAKKYEENTTVKGSFTKLEDIIPSKSEDGKPNAKPDGYVTLTFDKGEHGKEITGQTVYYVNPKADPAKTLADITNKPNVKADTGYEFTGWDTDETFEIKADKTVKAQYEVFPDVIPEKDDDGNTNKKPDGYIKVTFSTESNGKIKDTEDTKKVVYVNPNKAVKLEDFVPKVTPNTGYDFAGWDTQIDKKIQYSDGDTIKALYNKKGDVIPKYNEDGSENDKPDGYLTVTFKEGDHGSLEGKTVYYVKPNTEVTVPAPEVKPNVGYSFDKWDKKLTQTFKENTDITALYKDRDDIIPQEKPDGSDKPEGYVTISFVADENGSLSGKTVYYVNPNKEVDLTNTANEITKKPNHGFAADGGEWTDQGNKAILKATFTEDKTFVYHFEPYKDVIPAGNLDKRPEGYVTVTLIPTNKATDDKNIVYYVNPKATVTLPNDDPVGKNFKDSSKNDFNYTFIGWTVTKGSINSWMKNGEEKVNITGQFIQDTEITAKYKMNAGTIIARPIPKDNVITPQGTVPNPEDLIKNIYDKNDPNNKNNLPNGSKITYEEEPKVNDAGKVTAKVKVEYPDGSTVVVEVPITVTNDIIEEHDGQKQNVPEGYVKVTVNPTDKATENTKDIRIFWVNPEKEVKLPIKSPTGKENYKFKEWKLGINADGEVYNPNEGKKFTKETFITATYIEKTKAGDIEVVDGDIISKPLIVDQGATVDPSLYELKTNDGRKIVKQIVKKQPDTREGDKFTSAIIEVRLDDGTTLETKVLLYVRKPCETCPEPTPNPGKDPESPGKDPEKPGKDPESPGKDPEKPGKDPESPGKDPEKPGKDPEKPGETPEPGDKPEPKPGETPEPGEKPSDKPGKDPESPGEIPSDKPGEDSGNKQTHETNKNPGKIVENTAKKVIESVEKTVKKAFNPRTGIFTNLDIYLGIMAASSLGLFVTRDKKEDE